LGLAFLPQEFPQFLAVGDSHAAVADDRHVCLPGVLPSAIALIYNPERLNISGWHAFIQENFTLRLKNGVGMLGKENISPYGRNDHWRNSGDTSLYFSLRPRLVFSQFPAERFLEVVNKVR
jgi:hypothetical protein